MSFHKKNNNFLSFLKFKNSFPNLIISNYMASNATLFVAMYVSEFQELIAQTIKNELKNFTIIPQQIQEDKLLNMEEAGAFLRVSKVTLHKWKNRKMIKAHRIGRKLYFSQQELLDSVKSIPKVNNNK